MQEILRSISEGSCGLLVALDSSDLALGGADEAAVGRDDEQALLVGRAEDDATALADVGRQRQVEHALRRPVVQDAEPRHQLGGTLLLARSAQRLYQVAEAVHRLPARHQPATHCFLTCALTF